MATATAQPARPATGIARFFPILQWLPTYQRGWLRFDLIAGLTILALLIPEGMAYAELAGLPPQTAFYAAPIGLLLYAIFGTSRQLMVAVSAVIATMSAAAVAPLAAAGSTEYAIYSAALALLAGIISVLAGLFKLGRIASFFSESVLVGFITGLALTVAIKQVPKLFGIESGSGNFWERLYDIIRVHLWNCEHRCSDQSDKRETSAQSGDLTKDSILHGGTRWHCATPIRFWKVLRFNAWDNLSWNCVSGGQVARPTLNALNMSCMNRSKRWNASFWLPNWPITMSPRPKSKWGA